MKYKVCGVRARITTNLGPLNVAIKDQKNEKYIVPTVNYHHGLSWYLFHKMKNHSLILLFLAFFCFYGNRFL